LKTLTNVLLLSLRALRKNKNVIHIDKNEASNHIRQNIINQALENGMTKYSKSPSVVLNAIFYSSPFLMRTRW
jgi:hypothetical protein